jgi:PAS domain S-box-containing protein
MSSGDHFPPTDAHEEMAFLAAIVESSEDAIISKDLNGIVRSCNAAAERMFGYSAAELVGQPVRLIIPPERLAEEDDILDRIRRGEHVHHFQTVRRAKNGHLVDVSLTISPVRDRNGKVVGASKIARDIGDQKHAVAERERLLEAERLARAEAERASRVKDDFVAMVSHELRTPLTAILGWTQLMTRARNDHAVVARGLDVIARNTRLQAQLISDLLDISRIVAGKLQLDARSVDLKSIVAQAVETIEGDARTKGVAIVQAFDDDRTSLVSGDPARLQQIVWNLLSNAIKFTPAGGRVEVRLRFTGADARIEVTDNGAGISAEALPHIFERFHQADRSITRRFGGLGLGLAIVKHLVELHAGDVQVASEGEGRGATFVVTLPVVSDTTGQERRRSRSTDDAVVGLEAIRLLVVEDEADTLEFLRRLLTTHGATVLTAASAPEALSLVRKETPDVLISDIGLPEMDGYDLIQRVRREPSPARDVPAIALTAYARSEDRTRALRAGFQAHLAKPVEPSELVAMIASFVELTGAQRKR